MARLALSAGRVVPWAKGAAGSRPTGRGASLHPTEACVRKAFKTGAFARAFKGRAESLDEADFFHQLTAATAALRREKP
jgi:predicted RNA-binding protein YlxR (DUF448 family)